MSNLLPIYTNKTKIIKTMLKNGVKFFKEVVASSMLFFCSFLVDVKGITSGDAMAMALLLALTIISAAFFLFFCDPFTKALISILLVTFEDDVSSVALVLTLPLHFVMTVSSVAFFFFFFCLLAVALDKGDVKTASNDCLVESASFSGFSFCFLSWPSYEAMSM